MYYEKNRFIPVPRENTAKSGFNFADVKGTEKNYACRRRDFKKKGFFREICRAAFSFTEEFISPFLSLFRCLDECRATFELLAVY